MTETERVLKVDAQGRVWTPRERREDLLAEFERSGMPASKFARHIGVKYSTFGKRPPERRLTRWLASDRWADQICHSRGGYKIYAAARLATCCALAQAAGVMSLI
jgi:hypothetical protein